MPGVSKWLEGEHGNLHYVDYGGAGSRGLVMLHGGGANTHWFDFIGPTLAKHCHALALDLRGHGDSDHMDASVYTPDAYMDDIGALIEAEKLHQPILMGHSMGGMLMVRFTGARPQEVGALIVCDSRPVYGEADQERLQRTANRPGREYESQADYIAHFLIRPEGLRSTPEMHHYIAERAGKQLPHGAWVHKVDRQTYAHRPMIDTLPLYQQMTCPVLYLWAAYSRVTEEMIQGVREACPHVEIIPVAEAGHHLMLDQPQQTIALVQAFLQRHQLVSETTLT
jgi:pimeloyl-ACP methyl ester carboxylesterase